MNFNINKRKTRIAIVGGGISGISAAFFLTKERDDVDVVVFEANSRIGGRINSIDFGSSLTKIELGAQWIHGISSNPLYNLAINEGIITDKCVVEESVYLKTNSLIAPLNVSSISPDFFNKLQETFSLIAEAPDSDREQKDHITKYNNSLGQFLTREYFSKIAERSLTNVEHVVAKTVFEHLTSLQCFHEGCSNLKDVSLESAFAYPEGEGNVQIPSGYTSLLTKIINYMKECPIHLSTSVDRIKIKKENGHLKTVHLDLSRESTRWEEAFDHVIVTSSLGFIQKHHGTMFCDPPLPIRKVQALQSLHFGIVEKVFLEFSEDIIPFEIEEIQCIVNRHKLPRGSWAETIPMWYAIGSTRKVFMGLLLGEAAKQMAQLSLDEVGKKCHKVLEDSMKTKLPPLKNVTRSEWHKTPSICGSYTYCPHSANLSAFRDIMEPIIDDRSKKPLVLFAGEHTQPTQYASVHGAYMSGIREAERILNWMKSPKEQLKSFL